jgi:hypothetical protein
MLTRREFCFSDLKGLLGKEKMRDLCLGEAFATPGAHEFILALRDANPRLREPIMEEIRKLESTPTRTHQERNRTRSRIQEIFIEDGIFTDFSRPASVGLILAKTEILGVDTYLILGKSSPAVLHSGRLNMNAENPTLIINVTNAAGRLMETLDVMFMVSDPMLRGRDPALVKDIMRRYDISESEARSFIDDIFIMRNAMRKSREELNPIFSKTEFDREDMPFLNVLDVVSTRASIARLERSMLESDEEGAFVMDAINAYVNAKLAHETCHIIERKANSALSMNERQMELLAYLMEAAYARPDIAFSALLSQADAGPQRNRIDVKADIPDLAEDIFRLNGSAFLQDEGYLRIWASRCVDDRFRKLTGQAHTDLVDVDPIRKIQDARFLGPAHMPLLEKAVCNPTFRGVI